MFSFFNKLFQQPTPKFSRITMGEKDILLIHVPHQMEKERIEYIFKTLSCIVDKNMICIIPEELNLSVLSFEDDIKLKELGLQRIKE